MKNKKQPKNKTHIKDLIILSTLPIMGSILAWLLPVNYFQSLLLILGLPILYLSFRNQKGVGRAIIFSAAFMVIGSLIDYLGMLDGAWNTYTVFSVKVLGTVPIEDFVFGFLLVWLIVMYYEFFFDHLRHALYSRRLFDLLLISVVLVVLFGLYISLSDHLPHVRYFYLKAGVLFGLLPIVAFLLKFPRFLATFLKMAPYFLGVTFLIELVGLHKNFWVFSGQHFIAWVSFGSFRFPVEELIFWMVLFSSTTMIYFETFDDNRLRLKPVFKRS